MAGATYVLLALGAGGAWAVTNALDDRAVDRWDGATGALAGAGGLVRGLAVPLFALVGLLPVPSVGVVLLGVAAGVASFVAIVIYYRAIDRGDVVQFAVVSETEALFVLLAAVLVLGERLSTREVVGVLALLAGAVLVTADRRGVRVALRPEARPILLATLLFASISVLSEIAIDGFDNGLALVGWLAVGTAGAAAVAVGAGAVPSGPVRRVLLTPDVRRPLLAGATAEAVGYAAYFTALSLGPVAVATALLAVQPFLALVGVAVLRRSLAEADAFEPRTVAVRSVASLLVLVGVALVA